mgnify:CR=1 FL=1
MVENRVFVDTHVVPAQLHNHRYETFEIRLIQGVIEDAVQCYMTHLRSVTALRKRQEAEEWFASADRSWPYAFLNLCDYLGVNADAFRRNLSAMREEQHQHYRRHRPQSGGFHRVGTQQQKIAA